MLQVDWAGPAGGGPVGPHFSGIVYLKGDMSSSKKVTRKI
jgi:hypothetical protein